MMNPWWIVGASSMALVLPKMLLGRGRRRRDAGETLADDWNNEPRFYCERVCASEKMMDKMGGWAKDAAPSNCLTVCGISREDACLDACARVICVGPSPVPSWNEKCLSRCSEQCMKGRSAQKG